MRQTKPKPPAKRLSTTTIQQMVLHINGGDEYIRFTNDTIELEA